VRRVPICLFGACVMVQACTSWLLKHLWLRTTDLAASSKPGLLEAQGKGGARRVPDRNGMAGEQGKTHIPLALNFSM
jgi:hypothetical protein